jgi:hypothetical protein
MTNRNRIAAVLIGLFGGFIVGLTSVGSGTFFGLTMLILFPLGAQKMVGTDILHAAALLYVAGAGHLVAGNVDLGVVGWLLLGSIPGILVGSQWSIRLPEAVLRWALATLLLLTGVKLAAPGGAGVGVAVAVGIGLAGLLAYGLVARRVGSKPTVGSGKPKPELRPPVLASDTPVAARAIRDG